jgi:hypothetical protein
MKEGREKKNEEKEDRISNFASSLFTFPTSVSVTVTMLTSRTKSEMKSS